MKILFNEYPKCSTCKKAKKWLDDHEIRYDDRHIVENNPSKDELKEWLAKSNKPVRKFFNTSGRLYRELGLRDKLDSMSEDEQLEVLASDGMLIKRPLVVGDDFVLSGFREKEWERQFKS
ncbi:arsenate reductase family protein [Mogibacterium timidum]|uniref:Transcriptional regulator, Spx/MgsR family n=2 Tax=Mogibacterium timidum TaxID=35519 RepID=X8ITD1_9FIRM|nr:arsenate reductase family protein [Mogibacterium timidum]EUC53388.1 transcriptional regulator, Spx/MgsR family [Mogibacterium timidum ATCC 33093]NWO23537.1 arsenate reductase family protein [Mogibacterium timidum]